MNHPPADLEALTLPQGLRGLFNRLEPQRPETQQLEVFIEEAFGALRGPLRLTGVVVYAERRDGFELRKQLGWAVGAPASTLPPACPSLRPVLDHRVYIFDDPGEDDSPSNDDILPRGPSAGVVIGRRPHRHLLFFLLEEGWIREHVDLALNVLRAAFGLHLLEERVQINLRQAAEIQESLLRETPPGFPGFEIACRSIPAEEVSGDFCDFVHVERDLVGFALGDASGHGLPAALLVRDLVTGLRMGFEKHLRMEYVFGKLNRVIHRSNLSSRFVSVFYGELESNGNFTYVNAGHQPPLLFRRDRIVELRMGGTVIGPLPEVYFRRGFVSLEPGNVLLLFTDGLVERKGPGEDYFGEERLRSLVQANEGRSAHELVDLVFDAAFAHGEGRPWDDDVTAMVIRRPAG